MGGRTMIAGMLIRPGVTVWSEAVAEGLDTGAAGLDTLLPTTIPPLLLTCTNLSCFCNFSTSWKTLEQRLHTKSEIVVAIAAVNASWRPPKSLLGPPAAVKTSKSSWLCSSPSFEPRFPRERPMEKSLYIFSMQQSRDAELIVVRSQCGFFVHAKAVMCWTRIQLNNGCIQFSLREVLLQ